MTATEQTPPVWLSFVRCWAGTLCMLPGFLGWCAVVAARRLHDLDWALTLKCRSSAPWLTIASRCGDGWLYAGMVLYLVHTGREELAGHVAACLVLAWGASALLKIIVRRRRPEDQLLERLSLAKLRPSLLSFPSQHAACAVAFAMSMHGPWWGFALVVAASRVALGAHFLGDVLAGIAVGVAAGIYG